MMKRSSAAGFALAALAVLTAGCGYNTIQTMDERVNQAQGQIQTQLQRRADLIPNLVNTVKGITKQEDTVFISIANARSRLGGAIQSGNIPEMAAANNALNQGLGRLIAISENYPELRSSENFRQLQDQLEGTENRISVARQDYNTAVGQYNAYIRRFPYNLTAKVFGMGQPRQYIDAAQGAWETPKVNFKGRRRRRRRRGPHETSPRC
jgi:LemA protein